LPGRRCRKVTARANLEAAHRTDIGCHHALARAH
jgi:hypothetical protein